jgi:hypothetical protein
MIPQILSNAVRTMTSSTLKEHFGTSDSQEISPYFALIATITSLVVFVLIIVILALIGKYLWNTIVAGANSGSGLFKQIKEVDGIAEIIGLYILVSLFLH